MSLVAFACRPYRATLEALVAHGERDALTPAALDHLGIKYPTVRTGAAQ